MSNVQGMSIVMLEIVQNCTEMKQCGHHRRIDDMCPSPTRGSESVHIYLEKSIMLD